MNAIAYREGYKYQVSETCTVVTDIHPDNTIETEYINLDKNGVLTIREGYAWDGPSGPTFDTLNFMRGSLYHDCCYQLMREGYLPKSCRDDADLLLWKTCLEDGMSRVRAWYVYKAVRKFAGPCADPSHEKPVIWAPTKPA